MASWNRKNYKSKKDLANGFKIVFLFIFAVIILLYILLKEMVCIVKSLCAKYKIL